MAELTLWQRIKELGTHFLTAVIGGAYLALWVVVQHWFGLIIRRSDLDTLDAIVLFLARAAFGAWTIVPLLIWIWRDAKKMIIRARRDIELERSETTPAKPALDKEGSGELAVSTSAKATTDGSEVYEDNE